MLSTSPYDYKTIAKNAFEGLVNNYTYLDANGDMQIWGSCRSAGLGGDKDTALKGAEKYRNGSNEYYLLGYDVPMVKQSEGKTEGKVLGGFIMAATEYERAYQNQNTNSKQILFAKDLAPNMTSLLLKGNSMQQLMVMVPFLISGIRVMVQKLQMPQLLFILQQKMEVIIA